MMCMYMYNDVQSTCRCHMHWSHTYMHLLILFPIAGVATLQSWIQYAIASYIVMCSRKRGASISEHALISSFIQPRGGATSHTPSACDEANKTLKTVVPLPVSLLTIHCSSIVRFKQSTVRVAWMITWCARTCICNKFGCTNHWVSLSVPKPLNFQTVFLLERNLRNVL